MGKPSLSILPVIFFAKLTRFTDRKLVKLSLENKLDRLEMLFTEQDQTIQSLNDIIAKQDSEIRNLQSEVKRINDQLTEVKNDFSESSNPADERPPHY